MLQFQCCTFYSFAFRLREIPENSIAMIWKCSQGPKEAVARRVGLGAGRWGVGPQTRRVGSQLPPAPTEFNPSRTVCRL